MVHTKLFYYILQELGLAHEPHGDSLRTSKSEHHDLSLGTRRRYVGGGVVGHGLEHEVGCCGRREEEGDVEAGRAVSEMPRDEADEHVDAKAQVLVSSVAEEIQDGQRDLHHVETNADCDDLEHLDDEAIGGDVGDDLRIELARRPVTQSAEEAVGNQAH